MKKHLIAILLGLSSTSVFAISAAEISTVKASDQLEWKNGDKMMSIKIETVNTIKEPDGSTWFIANGKTADGQIISWMLDPTGNGEIGLIGKRMNPKEAGFTKKDVFQADKKGQGSITYNGVEYEYSADDSDDVKFMETPSSSEDEISIYSFVSKQDDDDGLMVIEWDDDNLEVLETEFHENAELTLVPAK